MNNNDELEKKLNYSMPDGGPVYAETDLSHAIAEPWNAVSSLSLVLSGIYWLIRLKGQYREYVFLIICSMLLAVGGVGSTIFHAFRKSAFFLYLDFMPIIILIYTLSIYFQFKLFLKRWLVLFIVAIDLTLRYVLFTSPIKQHNAINISYFISGMMVFVPLMFYLLKTKFSGWQYVALSFILLGIALFFRIVDSYNPPLICVGTHWLWHVFCAAGAFSLGKYLYKSITFQIKTATIDCT